SSLPESLLSSSETSSSYETAASSSLSLLSSSLSAPSLSETSSSSQSPLSSSQSALSLSETLMSLSKALSCLLFSIPMRCQPNGKSNKKGQKFPSVVREPLSLYLKV